MICGALAAYDYGTFEDLITHSVRSSEVSYLQDVTSHNDFLKVVLIKWYMEGNVSIDDIYCHESSSKVGVPSPPLRKKLGEMQYVFPLLMISSQFNLVRLSS